jgi:polyisoprenoid-binding protein YceI
MKILFAIFLLLPVCAFIKPQGIFTCNNGAASFKSEAPLELINAASKELKGAIDISKNTFAFRIRIKSFEGFNSPLQKEHFNENYMESMKFPEATFAGKIIETIDYSKKGKHTIRAKGKLLIHGIEQERIIKSDIEILGSSIIIKSTFTVLLSDHQIPIPRVVKEKLANEITVTIHAELVSK